MSTYILIYSGSDLAYLMQFSGGGVTEYVICLISQLLWKEKTPPIMMSPSSITEVIQAVLAEYRQFHLLW